MDEPQDWPLSVREIDPRLAWFPPEASPELAAVPVTPGDLKDGLTPAGYRRRLMQRVAWMISREDDPAQALRFLEREMDDLGLGCSGRLGTRTTRQSRCGRCCRTTLCGRTT